MKVLFWMNNGFDVHSTSEHLLSAVIEQLAKNGHQVHVLQSNQRGSLPILPKKLADLGVTTDSVPHKSVNKSNFVARYLNAAFYYWRCRNFLKTNRESDVVFLQSTNVAGVAVWLVRRFMRRAIVTINVQDIFPYNAVYSGNVKRNSVAFSGLAAVQRYGYRHSDQVITISEDMKDTLVLDGTEANKVKVIYNWSYQDEVYENIDFTAISQMFNPAFFNVVYAGNIGVMQNVDILIETAKQMKSDKDVWFHIIGNGVYKEKLEARAKEYNITNISFWPMQPPELAPAVYSAADVNVIPLVKDVYRTALPSKTATCLACQKPIIFAIGKESKFGKKVEQETGCPIVAPDNPGELAKAIINIKNGSINVTTKEFFMNNCGITFNSKRYAQIITGEC